MARGPRYSVKFRRRRESKTNYKKRVSSLKSNKARLVVRTTNNLIVAQVIDYFPKGDKTLNEVNSRSLEKFGWKHNKSNIPAAYLTGFLLGSQSKIKEAILDIGKLNSRKGVKIYAVAKGFKDAGINLHFKEDMSPSEDRIKGKHISEKLEKDFDKVKKKLTSKQ